MSTYERRANLAAAQPHEPALESVRPLAPVEARAPMLMGATSIESEPMNASSPMVVWVFLTPS